MLKIGGYINIFIAVAHLIGLAWAEAMFEVTGIGEEMNELSSVHWSIPYLMTIFVAIVFFVFGLYGLSAASKFRTLPWLKPAIFVIAGIYLFRGVGELIFDIPCQVAPPLTEALYSMVAVVIGLLYLIGGLKKWRGKQG